MSKICILIFAVFMQMYVTLFHSSIAIILMGKRELVALLNLSSWCLVMVEWLFLAVPWGCLRSVIVVFPEILTYYFFLFLLVKSVMQIRVPGCIYML